MRLMQIAPQETHDMITNISPLCRRQASNGFKLPLPTLVRVVSLLMLAAAPALSQSPWAATQPAGPVGQAGATLNGMATARGYATAAWFEWGGDASYGHATTLTNIGTNRQVARVSAPIDGLAPGTTCHYRLVASNDFGTAFGADNVFTTGMKGATWNDPSGSSGNYPAIPRGLTNIVGQACGHVHSLAITSDGAVVTWGVGIPYFWDNYGQTNVPADLSNIVAVAGGWVHSLALRQDGTVCAWGTYLGSVIQPAYVPSGLSNVVAIAGGDAHSLALKSDGTVVGWGDNSFQQIAVPHGLTNVVAIAAGSAHSLALKADGKVVAWGRYPGYVIQTPPSDLSNVVAIAAETWHNLALRRDGTVVAWGANTDGQSSVPAGLSNVLAIAAGLEHSLALKTDGTLVAWGNAAYVTNVPAGLSSVIAISSGDYHSLALTPVNLPPRALAHSAAGALNTDVIISLEGWDPNGDALSFRISSPPTNGTLYQYTGSGRGDPITARDTPVSNALWVLFSPSLDSLGAPYTTFGFSASDGQYDSLPALATVTILPPLLVQAAGFVQSSNAGFALSFDGLSNAAYSVQASTNLVNWSRIGAASQPSPGQFFFLDTGATNRPQRFYRVTSP
jgi:Regulator of chromosome condensation (RCC1) repeat